MDWFHCNRCFRQDGTRFAVTSCGHVLCEGCGGAGACPVCAAACRRLPVSNQMRPEEKIFFRSPAAIALRHLEHVAQVCRFQRAQAELLLAGHREAARRARDRAHEAQRLLGTRQRELEALQRENAELRRAQLSPGWRGGSRNGTPRPIGITSPAQTVTPQPRRQLSGQVVSRSTPLESPRRTPIWQSGTAHRGSGTPLLVSAGPSPGSSHPLRLLWATPPPPAPAAAIFRGDTPPPPRPPRRA